MVVIRGEGPKGGPGMPEMLTPTSAIMGAGLGKVTRHRFMSFLVSFVTNRRVFLLRIIFKLIAFH